MNAPLFAIELLVGLMMGCTRACAVQDLFFTACFKWGYLISSGILTVKRLTSFDCVARSLAARLALRTVALRCSVTMKDPVCCCDALVCGVALDIATRFSFKMSKFSAA
jgi:hypothetical protein